MKESVERMREGQADVTREPYEKPTVEVAPVSSVVRGTPAGSAPDVGPGRKPGG